MRYIHYAFLGALAVVLISIALANRDAVTLRLLPDGLADIANFQQMATLPLYFVIFGSIGFGLLIGFVWEYLREAKIRQEARRKAAELRKMQCEIKRVKVQRDEGKDDVLALVDETS
ncbi:MAG: LapA family protein [Primorskyibacter sp.]